MIIEDNDNMREYIKNLIKDFKGEIIESDNGTEAVKLYNQHLPDAVLMDIELNGMDGLTASEKITRKHPEAKIIFITNYDDANYRKRAADLNCFAYILKENLYQLAPALINISTTNRGDRL